MKRGVVEGDNCATFTADMQKVFLIPKLTSKEHVFISRLVVSNKTFASLDKGWGRTY